MKTICVFGADGRTGRRVVEEMSKREEYDVVACTYSTFDASALGENVRTLHCDITKESDVEQALEGVDAVISVVGHMSGSDRLFQTEGAKLIVQKMKARAT